MSLTIDDLKTLPFNELLELKSNVEKVIKTYQKDKEREITQRFIAEMQAIGVSAEALKNMNFSANKLKKPAKYKNPNDNTQTWNGYGPAPKWLKGLLDSGRSKEEFEI